MIGPAKQPTVDPKTTNHYKGVYYFTKAHADAVTRQYEGSSLSKTDRGFVVTLANGQRLGPSTNGAAT